MIHRIVQYYFISITTSQHFMMIHICDNLSFTIEWSTSSGLLMMRYARADLTILAIE
jgi:hypothetical protein